MPAITALDHLGRGAIGPCAGGLAGRARRGLKQLAEKVKNRHDAMRLAELDDRMLADIGLSRSDLRDAFALPPWRDPGDVLARRVAERRGRRPRTESNCVPVTTVSTELFGTMPAPCYPPNERRSELFALADPPIGHRPERRFPLPPSGCCARRPPAGAFFCRLIGAMRSGTALASKPQASLTCGRAINRKAAAWMRFFLACVLALGCSPSCRRARKPDSTGRAATMPASRCRPAIPRCARRAATATGAAGPGPSPIRARPRSAAAISRRAG